MLRRTLLKALTTIPFIGFGFKTKSETLEWKSEPVFWFEHATKLAKWYKSRIPIYDIDFSGNVNIKTNDGSKWLCRVYSRDANTQQNYWLSNLITSMSNDFENGKFFYHDFAFCRFTDNGYGVAINVTNDYNKQKRNLFINYEPKIIDYTDISTRFRTEILEYKDIPIEWTKASGFNHKNSIGGYQITNIVKDGDSNTFKWRGKLIRIPFNHMICGNEYDDGTCYVSLQDMTNSHPCFKLTMRWGKFRVI